MQGKKKLVFGYFGLKIVIVATKCLWANVCNMPAIM